MYFKMNLKITIYGFYYAIFFGISYAFIDLEITEKIFVQTVGIAKFATQTEEKRPLFQDVNFFLYTKKNPEIPIKLYVNDQKILKNSTFDISGSTVMIIHGFTDHKDRDMIIKLRRVLIANTDSNVIVICWKRLAALIYFNAAASAISVGRYLTEFFIFLENCNVDLSKIHLVGHSLGAQIAGIAGSGVDGRIGRITALDPAGPLFDYVYVRNHTDSLDPNDAKFVDVIHTAGQTFGVMRPIGHADFYPNDGVTPQPGCTNIITSVSCSHIRAVDYFIESVNSTKEFLGKPCYSWHNDFLIKCVPNNLVPMGYPTPVTARGNFYLQTNDTPPYAMGNKFYKRII